MTRSARGFTALPKLSLDLIVTQTFDNISILADTAGIAFDATKGLGHASNTSQTGYVHCGGFDNQRLTGVINFPSPTTAGTEDMGLIIGALCNQGTSQNYLWARVKNGTASIVSVVNSTTFTTIGTAQAWSVAQAVDITITFSRITTSTGGALSALFHAASGPSDVTVTASLASNSNLLHGGVMGWKTNAKALWAKSFVAEQLAA